MIKRQKWNNDIVIKKGKNFHLLVKYARIVEKMYGLTKDMSIEEKMRKIKSYHVIKNGKIDSM